jgi:hypothetical protein
MSARFWAKTGQGEMREDGQPKYHPVICHLADTSAVQIVGVEANGDHHLFRIRLWDLPPLWLKGTILKKLSL